MHDIIRALRFMDATQIVVRMAANKFIAIELNVIITE